MPHLPISGIKTVADAISAVEAVTPPEPLPTPAPLPADASAQVKADYEAAAQEVIRRNGFIAREVELVADVKALALARLRSLPSAVQVVGLEIRADIGAGMQVVLLRIIEH